MALVVFLKGVNVGKHRRFLPASLAKEMSDLDVVNVGAVGTFVVKKAITAAAFRAELSRRLPFEAEAMTCTGTELLALVASDPFKSPPAGKDVRPMLTILARKPKMTPKLPLRRPEGKAWQVELFRVDGPFALTFWRPDPKKLLYIDLEKDLGVSGTTRTWKTIEKICAILRA